jgi:hypothetical protein
LLANDNNQLSNLKLRLQVVDKILKAGEFEDRQSAYDRAYMEAIDNSQIREFLRANREELLKKDPTAVTSTFETNTSKGITLGKNLLSPLSTKIFTPFSVRNLNNP